MIARRRKPRPTSRPGATRAIPSGPAVDHRVPHPREDVRPRPGARPRRTASRGLIRTSVETSRKRQHPQKGPVARCGIDQCKARGGGLLGFGVQRHAIVGLATPGARPRPGPRAPDQRGACRSASSSACRGLGLPAAPRPSSSCARRRGPRPASVSSTAPSGWDAAPRANAVVATARSRSAATLYTGLGLHHAAGSRSRRRAALSGDGRGPMSMTTTSTCATSTTGRE